MSEVRLYGCHNKPRPVAGVTSYKGQHGWEYGFENWGSCSRTPIMVNVVHTMSTDCRYDKSAADPACAGCQWIGKSTEKEV